MSLWDLAKMKDSILMKGCSIPHRKADRLRAVSQQEPLVRNVIPGYIKHNEADYRYITTCQEKGCHLEMCTINDYPASRNFLHCSQRKERGAHCLCQRSALSSPRWHSGNRVRLGRKGDGSWAAPLCFHGRFDGSKQSADPATAPNISRPSATGTRHQPWCGRFFPGHLTGYMKQTKTISKKREVDNWTLFWNWPVLLAINRYLIHQQKMSRFL